MHRLTAVFLMAMTLAIPSAGSAQTTDHPYFRYYGVTPNVTGGNNGGGTGEPSHDASQPLTLTGPDTVSGRMGAFSTASFTVGNAAPGPLTWSSIGALPSGVSFTDGTLSGTPGEANTFPLTVTATDSAGRSGTATLTLTVKPALAISLSGPIPGAMGSSIINRTPSVSGEPTGPLAWRLVSGSLPPGLTLDTATGRISGTPTEAGPFAAVIAVRDAEGFEAVSGTVTFPVATSPLLLASSIMRYSTSAGWSTVNDAPEPDFWIYKDHRSFNINVASSPSTAYYVYNFMFPYEVRASKVRLTGTNSSQFHMTVNAYLNGEQTFSRGFWVDPGLSEFTLPAGFSGSQFRVTFSTNTNRSGVARIQFLP